MSNVCAWLSGGHVHFLQLGLLKLQEDTPQADIDQEDVSLAGVLQSAVWYLRVRARRCSCWAIIHSFLRRDAIADWTVRIGTPFFQSFSVSWNSFYAQCWSCFWARCWLVEQPFLFIFNRKNKLRESQTGADVTVSDIRLAVECLTSDWQLKDCDTFCSMAYIFKGHLNNTRKWLFVFENIID